MHKYLGYRQEQYQAWVSVAYSTLSNLSFLGIRCPLWTCAALRPKSALALGRALCMRKIRDIEKWLRATRGRSTSGRYRHLLLKEYRPQWLSVREDVQAYFRAAHQDALQHFRTLAGISLDPLAPPAARDPGTVYPGEPLFMFSGSVVQILERNQDNSLES